MGSEAGHSQFGATTGPSAEEIVDLMLSALSDGLDHPELWEIIPNLSRDHALTPALLRRIAVEPDALVRASVRIILGMCAVAEDAGALTQVLAILSPLTSEFSQSLLVQGALFHLEGMADPGNPKYVLDGKVCLKPFVQVDVLDGATHLCCASWMPGSVGDLQKIDWRELWNGDSAQAIRATMFDGSYRYCNKRTCPAIQGNALTPLATLEADEKWRDIVHERRTVMDRGPERVNLAHDRTCNLSCPSCRTEAFAADDATRAGYAQMQERAVLPMLKNARTVYVTGSGDPFASKNFRRLMQQLTAEDYPELKFILMTNGMLLTPRQWAAFPSLHHRVESLRISLDAATGPTHELLRWGARWPVMVENMKFAGKLLADGLVDDLMLTFTVQTENYREMGDVVDLAHEIGATSIYFGRMTNWGTFSPVEYQAKAVFVPGHPEHAAFQEACRDPRLRDPMIYPSDLDAFFHAGVA